MLSRTWAELRLQIINRGLANNLVAHVAESPGVEILEVGVSHEELIAPKSRTTIARTREQLEQLDEVVLLNRKRKRLTAVRGRLVVHGSADAAEPGPRQPLEQRGQVHDGGEGRAERRRRQRLRQGQHEEDR